jgi:DNA replication protein DnaC
MAELTKRLRLPYLRKAMAEVVPTAKAQRWDPAEVVRILLAEEAAGRDAATLRSRRRRAAFPAGKTFDVWDEANSCIPRPTQAALRTLEWVQRRENLCICGPSGTGKSHFCEALGQAAVDNGLTVAWFTIEDLGALVRRHRPDDSMAKAIDRIIRTDLIIVDDIGLLPSPPRPPKGSTGWSMPHTNGAAWPCPATCTRLGSTRSCPRPSPPRPSTGSCTTPTSSLPKVTPTGSPKPPTDGG